MMNVVPRVAGPRVASKTHADETFFCRVRVADFGLRFVPAARDRSMWSLFHFSHCDAPSAFRTARWELSKFSLQERARCHTV